MPAAAQVQTRPILERFFNRAAVRAETGIAWVRLGVCVLVFTRLTAFGAATAAGPSRAKFWTVGVPVLVGIAWSVYVLGWLERTGPKLRRLIASVSVDAAIAFTALLAVAWWPSASYEGLVRVPDAGVLVLVTAGAGLRLSRRVAVVGIVEMGAVYAGLVAVDILHNGMELGQQAEALLMWFILYAGAAVLAVYVAVGTRRLVYEGVEAALTAERARQRLGIYVSEEVAAEALAAESLEAGGRRQPVAVLFSDLRGFTRYAERLEPERLVGELNAYLDAMVRAIRGEGGVVDKFIGDAIMVVFGVPAAREDDAARAIRTALAMNRALAEHNEERAAAGRPPLAHGIGVHFGPAVAGNIGNAERLQYTVIGDVVNLASRLESATKRQEADGLVSADAVAAARTAGADVSMLRALGPVSVPGHEAPVEVYGLPAISSPSS